MDERAYEVESVWMIIKLPCLRSDSTGRGEPEGEDTVFFFRSPAGLTKTVPVLVKMGPPSACGCPRASHPGSFIHRTLARTNLPDSPTLLTRMPNSPLSLGGDFGFTGLNLVRGRHST